MNSTEIKTWLKTPKGKLIAACSVLVITWIILLINFAGGLAISLPNSERKAQLKQNIRKLRAELQLKEEILRKNDLRRKQWKEHAKACWQPKRDGDPELVLRQTIEAVAKKAEIQLTTLGTVRTNRINQDFAFAELDISAMAPLETIIKFIKLIQQQKPEIAWRRLNITAMMRRMRPNNSQTKTISGNSSENSLIFSANLRTMVYDANLPKDEKVKTTPEGESNNGPAMRHGPGMMPPPPPGGMRP